MCCRILAFILVSLIFATALRAETELIVALDRTSLYEGETLWMQVGISSDKPIGESVSPDISALTDFKVDVQPKQVQNGMRSSSVVIVNGRMVRNEETSKNLTVFTYILTPKRTGSVPLPIPKVVVDGNPLPLKSVKIGGTTQRLGPTTESIPLTVQAPDKQDVVRMEITANKKKIYPCQPFTVTLSVLIKSPSERQVNPLSLIDPPQLTIPWGNDKALPKGLTPDKPIEAWLTALNVRGRHSGFSINGLSSRGFGFGFDDDFFGSPFRETLLLFSPVPNQVKRPDAEGKEQTYWEYKFSRTFTPKDLGRLSFGPANVKGIFAVADPTLSSGIRGERIFAIAPAAEVQVVDVPEENRPADYIGAFGSYQWNVDLQPRKASVGEPITLTLRLDGRGSTDNVTAPDLAKIPEIAEYFKIHPPTEDSQGDSCSFTYTIRPLKPGKIEFPSIPVAFFDTEKESFVQRKSEPIPLEITAAEALHITPPPNAAIPVGGELERSAEGLYANMTAPNGVRNQAVDFPRWCVMMGSLVVGYFLLFGSVVAWRRWNSDPARNRRRGAYSRAKKRLTEVEPGVPDSLQAVWNGYVADRTDSVEHGMTPKDVCVKLMELGVPDQQVAEVRGILEALDGARYGGLDLRSFDDLVVRSQKLLDEIEKY